MKKLVYLALSAIFGIFSLSACNDSSNTQSVQNTHKIKEQNANFTK